MNFINSRKNFGNLIYIFLNFCQMYNNYNQKLFNYFVKLKITFLLISFIVKFNFSYCEIFKFIYNRNYRFLTFILQQIRIQYSTPSYNEKNWKIYFTTESNIVYDSVVKWRSIIGDYYQVILLDHEKYIYINNVLK